jgi:hypothetical protein
MIAIEQVKTANFPLLPFVGFRPEANLYARHSEVYIRQLG